MRRKSGAGLRPARIILAVAAPLFAQAATVPFVGCASFGQAERLEAPHGSDKSLPISAKDAGALAYYESADGIGLLGPHGWYCEGASGSGGAGLFLSPQPIQHELSGWKGLDGPAIALNHITSENSGKFIIAEVMARVFPAYKAFATRVLQGLEAPLPEGPFPKDVLIHKSRTIVEYTTPAQANGLGNFNSWLGNNDLPIQGAAMIVYAPDGPNDPNLLILSVRLPRDLARLTPVIIRQTEIFAATQK
jgi:hypothetical protein